MYRVHLIISGDVQGVGYRMWTKNQTHELDLTGWVKNREDAAVEIVAEGGRGELEEFTKRCQHGPDVAMVEQVDVKWEEASGEFMTFEVEY